MRFTIKNYKKFQRIETPIRNIKSVVWKLIYSCELLYCNNNLENDDTYLSFAVVEFCSFLLSR